jgi:hypothetical protein
VSPLVAILILLLLAVVILVIAAPLRGHDPGAGAAPADPDAGVLAESQWPREPESGAGFAREELEAARESKYREIRDSELDYRTGKLSQEDYAAVDAQLRAEAIEILNRLEQLESSTGEDSAAETGGPQGA